MSIHHIYVFDIVLYYKQTPPQKSKNLDIFKIKKYSFLWFV